MTASVGGRTATCRQANAPGGTALVALGIERGILSISRCLVDPPKRGGGGFVEEGGNERGGEVIISSTDSPPPPLLAASKGHKGGGRGAKERRTAETFFPQWRTVHHKLNPLPKPPPGPVLYSLRRLLAFRFPKLVEGGEGGISREKGEEEETLRARMKKPLSRPLFHTLPHPHPPSSQPVRRERRRGG